MLMHRVPLNMQTITIKLERTKVIDLMLACSLVAASDGAGKKWDYLHDELKAAVDAADEKRKGDLIDVELF